MENWTSLSSPGYNKSTPCKRNYGNSNAKTSFFVVFFSSFQKFDFESAHLVPNEAIQVPQREEQERLECASLDWCRVIFPVESSVDVRLPYARWEDSLKGSHHCAWFSEI